MILSLVFAIASAAVPETCHALKENRILAKHLAPFDARFEAVAQDKFLSYAPAPGMQRVFHPSELDRLAGTQAATPALCFEWKLRKIEQNELLAAMKAALPDARITVEEISRTPVPEGSLELSPPAVGKLWRGFVHYGGSEKYPVWVRATVEVPGKRVVSVDALKPGEPIAAHQVKLEQGFFPAGPIAFSESLDQVIGRTVRTAVPAGASLRSSLLTATHDVKQGDIVTVKVASGGATITIQAKATHSAFRGGQVRLKNESSGKLFNAMVQEPGLATIAAGGMK